MTHSNDGYGHDHPLRARIQAFSPDEPGIVFPFSARLAREHGWTRGFAERVVDEYRRFLYLAMTAGHPVTPSVQVDEAWHQHLTYTRSYWEELCGRVLGRPLHHEPTKGGGAEGARFVDWYARTLDSYRAAFGQEPPPDIWPAPAERFAAAARTRQVSGATHWIIRKPRLPRRTAAVALALGSLLLAAACAGDGGASLSVMVVVVLIAGLAATALTRTPSAPAPAHGPAKKREDSAGGDSTGTSGSDWGSPSGCDPGSDGDCDSGGGDSGGGDSGCSSGCSGCGGCGS